MVGSELTAATLAKPNALVVDDEESIRKLVGYTLQASGFSTELIADGATALERMVSNPNTVDIVILDVMLPGMSGFDVCRELRQSNIEVPIILLTARDDEIDRVVGLELGADDYVAKPFSPRELVARVKAVLRRTQGQRAESVHGAATQSERLTAGDITMDLVGHEVTVRGEPVLLTPKEFDLLRYFMENPNRVLSREQLLNHVWGYTAVQDTRIVDVHVSHLRDKVDTPKQPRYIRTVRGIGYKFVNGAS
jgi:two-component system alkaline phosphatase synthesis response regulator PhoP